MPTTLAFKDVRFSVLRPFGWSRSRKSSTIPAQTDIENAQAAEWVGMTTAPPPLLVCGSAAWEIRLSQSAPGADAAGSVTTLRLECDGVALVDQTLVGCLRVSAFNERGGLSSTGVELAYLAGDCVPVPEPSTALGLVVGSVGLACFRPKGFVGAHIGQALRDRVFPAVWQHHVRDLDEAWAREVE